MSREFGIGPVPEGVDEPLRDFLTQARNMLLAGNRTGAFTGRFKGSLAGVAAGGSTTIVVPGGPGGGGYVYDPTPPPTPTGVSVGAGIDFVGVTTDPPTFTQGNGYGRTIVYGAKYDPVAGGPLPTFSNATIVHEFVGQVGTFPTEPATQWHIWVKWRTRDGIDSVSPQGGTNGTQVTTGQDVTKLLQALTGSITQSQLFSTLNSRIDLIDGPSSTAGTVNARVLAEATARAAAILAESTARTSAIGTLNAALASEESARISADSAEATSRSTLAAQLRGAYTGTDPAALTTGLVFNERQARVSAEGAIASSVTALSATVSSNTAAITAEQTARANADSALASQINTVSAVASGRNRTYSQPAAPTTGMVAGDVWFDSDDSNKAYRYNGTAWVATDDARIAANVAAIASEVTARANADTALASSITTLTSTVSGNSAAISTEATTRANADGHLGAQYTVRAQVSANGSTVVGGFGLSGTSGGTSGPTIDFGIVANRFYIAPPTGTSNVPSILPFIVQATPTTLNGAPIPAGVYLDSAFIRDLTAVVARMGSAWITNAMVASLAANKITAGSIAVGEYIQSSDYVSGTSGWRIGGNMAEFGFASIRGTLQAAQVAAGFVTASMMQAGIMSADNVLTRGLTVRDPSGNIILSSGVPLAEANASAGLRNSNVPASGGNVLSNPLFMNGNLDGWAATSYLLSTALYSSPLEAPAYAFNGNQGAFLLHNAAYVSDDAYTDLLPQSQYWPRVFPGKHYQFSFLVNPHRAGVQLYGYWVDAAGNWISAAGFIGFPGGTYSGLPANGAHPSTYKIDSGGHSGFGANESDYVRIYANGTAPAGAARLVPTLRMFQAPGQPSNYVFLARAMFCEIASPTAPLAPFDTGAGIFAGGQRITPATASTFIADLAVNTLQIANNAVTIPVGASLSSSVSATGSEITALSVGSIDTGGAPIFVIASVAVTGNASPLGNSPVVRLKVDGVTRATFTLTLGPSTSGSQQFVQSLYIASPGTGSKAIIVTIDGSVGGSGTVSAQVGGGLSGTTVIAIGTKK